MKNKLNLDKTIEELEKDVWKEIDYPSNLVRTIYLLRKKPLKAFTVEDLRICIGQNTGLQFLVPLAIEQLEKNIRSEGNYYPGDLLKNILGSEREFWKENKNYWTKVKEIYLRNKELLDSDNSYRQIRNSFEQFESIN
jgi:hypothetical protein